MKPRPKLAKEAREPDRRLHAVPQSVITLRPGSLISQMVKHRTIYLLLLPGLLFFLLFKIAPMWGLLLAFKDYNPFWDLSGVNGLVSNTSLICFPARTFISCCEIHLLLI